MKQVILLLVPVVFGNWVWAQYKPVDKGSSVQFTIKNFGINTGGSFSGLQGEINFDGRDLSKSSIQVSIDAASINTDNETRDDHLRQETYFDVKDYPRISFVSTKIAPSNKEGVLYIVGNLRIKNQTREISFPFTVSPEGNGYLFKGTFTINRKDFAVGGTSIISNNLEVQLSIVATK
jgi:polyisoprenoid-binding protein YceI